MIDILIANSSGIVDTSVHLVLEHGGVGERLVFDSVTLVELVLELYPVETQGVQEALHGVHQQKHRQSESKESKPQDPSLNE